MYGILRRNPAGSTPSGGHLLAWHGSECNSPLLLLGLLLAGGLRLGPAADGGERDELVAQTAANEGEENPFSIHFD